MSKEPLAGIGQAFLKERMANRKPSAKNGKRCQKKKK